MSRYVWPQVFGRGPLQSTLHNWAYQCARLQKARLRQICDARCKTKVGNHDDCNRSEKDQTHSTVPALGWGVLFFFFFSQKDLPFRISVQCYAQQVNMYLANVWRARHGGARGDIPNIIIIIIMVIIFCKSACFAI